MKKLNLSVCGLGVAHGLGDVQALASASQEDWYSAPPVDLSGLRNVFPGAALRRVPRYARLGLSAVLSAQDDARSKIPQIVPERLALIVATTYGCSALSCDFMDSIQESGPQLASPMAFSHSVNNMAAGLLSLLLGIRGPCHTVMAGSASLASSVDVARTLLLADRADSVILCALDEVDARLAAVMPGVPVMEGAVCLVLRLVEKQENMSLPRLLAPCWAPYTGTFASRPLEQAFTLATDIATLSPGERKDCSAYLPELYREIHIVVEHASQ